MSSGVLALKKGSSGSVGQDGVRDAVARGPAVDLAHVLDDERVAEIGAQRDRPEPVDRMRLAARLGAGERHAGGGAGGVETRDEIVRQERRVGRRARDPFDLRAVAGRPVERRQDAGERSGKARHVVRRRPAGR